MAKKPSLKVVGSTTDPDPPPRELGPPGAKLWRRTLAEISVDGLELDMLRQACRMEDRAEQLAMDIGNCREELQCRAFVVRTLARLKPKKTGPSLGRRPGPVAGAYSPFDED